MKSFAVFLPDKEQPEIIQGLSAVVTRKPDGLKVVIRHGLKSTSTFTGVIIFTEISEAIRVK